MDESNTRRIVILGKTGAGKSSLANTIFEEELFMIDHTVNSGTRECEAETKSVNGRSITLIDTPGFFDTDRSEEELKPEIVRCITECAPGPHAFLIVLKVERFTEHEQAVIEKIHQYFSEEVFRYATVVFTHGDQLPKGQTIEKFVEESKGLRDLVEKCGGRCHVIDNKHWNGNPMDEYRSNQLQVEKLLNTIEKINKANNGSCYTNEMLQAVEEEIQLEIEDIRPSAGNMSEEEIREQAKGRVIDKLLIKLAATTTGALLGALFGVAVMVEFVVTSLKESLGLEQFGKVTVGVGVIGAVAAAGGAVAGGTAAAAAAAGAAAATAAAAGAGAVGMSLITLAGAFAAMGAVKGGVTGYCAAEGAETPPEAAEMAAEAVKKEAQFVSNRTKNVCDSISQPQSNQSQNL